MRRLLAVLAFVAIALPRPVRADEFRLSWDRCFGDGNVYAKTFACDTNAGSELLVASYVADAGMPAMTGFDAVLDITNAAGALPNWWALNSTGCRSTGVSLSLSRPTGASACGTWSANVVGGLTRYMTPSTFPSSPSSNMARLTLTAATAPATAFPAGQETFLFSVAIPHANTTGPGACAGCNAPMCLTWSSMTLKNGNPASTVYLPSANTQSWAATVNWQSAHRGSTTRSCDPHLRTCFFQAECTLPTDAHTNTWGTIKSLYR